MASTTSEWSSRLGFILASAGSAIGLGAIWKFPFWAGVNGGGAFIIPYIIFTFTIGVALVIAEVAIGRRGRGSALTAMKRLGGPWFGYLGAFAVLTSFLIVSYYSVVGGWCVSYLVDAFTGNATSTDAEMLKNHFNSLVSDGTRNTAWHLVFLSLTCGVVIAGVEQGIERLSKYLMPTLFVLMLAIIVRGLTLPGAWDGVEYLFAFRPEAFSWDAMLQAMGFTFFSLCVGCGCMLTYGSYLDEDSNLLTGCSWIAFLGVIASLLGGLMIMPAVFAFGLDPTAGPGLTFITMPAVFAQLPFGQVFAVIFYLCLIVAAITSSVSMIEILVAFLVDEHDFGRPKAAVFSTVALAVVGALPCLSFGSLSDVTFFGGKTFFDVFDFLTSNISLPIGGLVILYLAGFKCWDVIRGNIAGHTERDAAFYTRLRFMICVLAPILVAAVLVSGLM